jgi:hypothetical protein
VAAAPVERHRISHRRLLQITGRVGAASLMFVVLMAN